MRRFAFFALAALIGVGGCGPSQRTLLLEVHVRAPIQRLRVVVISHAAAGSVSNTEHGVTRTSSEVSTDLPIRVAIAFEDRADVTVHLEGRTGTTGAPVYIATRCYVVEDKLTDDVLLVASDMSADMDGDGWPTLGDPFCRDPVPGVATGDQNCDHACTMGGAVDCSGCLPTTMGCTLVADHDATIHPGAPDLCEDGVDQDCDGHDARCVDSDGDGFTACGAVPTGGCDCDDRNPTIHPGAVDTCGDGVDQNCDGSDQFCDHDGDGYPANILVGGHPDCDDTDPSIHPGAMEVCTPPGGTPRDENCNGAIDELPECTPDDLDRDGYPRCTAPGVPPGCDCNDCDSAIHPGAPEVCDDHIDQDCVSGDLACLPGDVDHDGFASLAAMGNDCDDSLLTGPHAFPNAPEYCGDGVSQSCTVDQSCVGDTDGDRYVEMGMCEGNPDITPWKQESCNGIDDNCNGVIDEVPRDPATGVPVAFSGCVITQLSDTACDPMAANCAINFATDLLHCGGCRQTCNDATHLVADACTAGTCTCNGAAECDRSSNQTCCGAAGCRTLQSDRHFCGTCMTDCDVYGGLVDSCSSGNCSCGGLGAPCAAALLCCDATCVDPTNNPSHCGSCAACALANATSSCAGSACHILSCTPGYDNCDGMESTGCEQPLTADNHCGSCGTVCDVHGHCGGGVCACLAGWTGSGTSCSDIDECATGTPCGANSTCANNPGSYTCTCTPGYRSPSGVGNDCVDINECVTMPGVCGPGTCNNTPGGYTCACNPGYTPSGGTCVDIDECSTMPGVCGVGTCMNTVGSYNCVCPGGYTYTGGTCTDINECSNPMTCHADTGNGTCSNTTGGYTCACNAGYMASGSGLSATCVDINECATSTTCHAGSGWGTCTNAVPGFSCTCGAGYRRTGSGSFGQDCADVDECTMTPTICGPVGSHATCTNTVGSYTCGCVSGFGDCTGGVTDGCETTLGTTSNCSMCADMCSSPTPKCCPSGPSFACMNNSAC